VSDPTQIERAHYHKLVGRQITAILWEKIEGQPLPVLLLSGWDHDGNAATAAVLMDPEGNGPGHLDHNL
jgi:hypothetical protein